MIITGTTGTIDFRPTGQYSALTIQPNTFHFDGHEFVGGNWGTMPTELATLFDLAYRARRGDEAAIEVIRAANVYLTDIAGNVYISRDWKAREVGE